MRFLGVVLCILSAWQLGNAQQASGSYTEQQTQQPSPVREKQVPIATISVGYAYLWADQGMDDHRSLNGWLAKPTFNIANGWAAYLDASNYYGRNGKGSVNLHTYSLGVSKEVLAKEHLRPALFLQMGDSRNSNAGKVVNAYALLTGINLTTPLTKWVSLSVIPAEYVFTYPEGDARHSYNAKIALVFPIGKKHA